MDWLLEVSKGKLYASTYKIHLKILSPTAMIFIRKT